MVMTGHLRRRRNVRVRRRVHPLSQGVGEHHSGDKELPEIVVISDK